MIQKWLALMFLQTKTWKNIIQIGDTFLIIRTGLKHRLQAFLASKDFTEYSNDMDIIYKNIEE